MRNRQALSIRAAIFIAVISALLPARAFAVFTSLGAQAESNFSGEYISPTFTFNAQPHVNGLAVSSHFGPISGSAYVAPSTEIETFGYTDVYSPNEVFHTTMDFTFTFTGGVVSLTFVNTAISGGSNYVDGMLASSPTVTSGVPIHLTLVTGQYLHTAEHFGSDSVSSIIQFSWTGYAPGDTLSLDAPNIDVNLPEPMMGMMLLPGAIFLAVRRRRGNSIAE
jgi:hypothetical protein